MTRKTTAGLGAITLAVLVAVLNMLSNNGYKVVSKTHQPTIKVYYTPNINDHCRETGVYTPGVGVWGLVEPGKVTPFTVGEITNTDNGLYFLPVDSVSPPDTTCYLTLKRIE